MEKDSVNAVQYSNQCHQIVYLQWVKKWQDKPASTSRTVLGPNDKLL